MSIGREIPNSTNTARTAWKPLRLRLDIWLILAVFTLLIFGMLMVYSASTDYSMVVLGEAPSYMFRRQLLFAIGGVVLAAVLTWLDYHVYKKVAIPIIIVTIVGLASVLVVNEVINNAARTIFQGSGQPSEAAKLAVVLYLAVWLYARREQLSSVSFGLIPLSIILGLLGGLILLQPDLSATATIFIIGGIMFFLAGGDIRQIVFFLLVGLIVGWLVFRFHPTGNQRLAEYLISIKDLTQAPLHLSRSLEALVKGSWFGVGIGRADTKLTGLPVPPTDSIFAVIGEEVGVLGASVVVLLNLVILWRGLKISQLAPDGLGKLMAAGLSIWLALEALINMAVIVGLVPFAGNALPFISYGGSNLLVSLAAIGILLNISRVSSSSQEKEERSLNAVIDLRRRDRGWGVSRSRRAKGAAGR
ncbi:MAG: FtsW/RodA/SpoVE family cell cycle protein [Chloroflexota bacterium]|nr:MAG: FtsW/RodA/SpoVE family cell cycle protein [Chloroflexota bacterium]